MSDTTQNEIDPMDVPLGEIDTSFPKLIPDRLYKFIIRTPDIVDSRDKTSQMLLLKLETMEDNIDTEGRPLYKGVKFTTRIGVSPTGKRDKTSVSKDIGILAKTVGGDVLKLKFSEFMTNPRIILPLIDNKIVQCKVGMQPEKDGFPEQNSFKFVPAA